MNSILILLIQAIDVVKRVVQNEWRFAFIKLRLVLVDIRIWNLKKNNEVIIKFLHFLFR